MRKFSVSMSVLMMAIIVLTACSGSGSTGNGIPPAKAGTLLRNIQDRGKLVVGTMSDLFGFSYLNPTTNQMEGFDVAVAKEIAAYIFGDPNRVEFKLLTAADRIPMVKNGTIDLSVAAVTINDERLKEIDFSVVYYVAGQRILVPQASVVKGLTDLDNKKVATAKGSTSAANLKRLTKSQVVEFDTFSEAVTAMSKNQVDAVSTDDVILYGLQVSNPGTKVVGSQFSYEPYGIPVAKNNPELVEVVNTVVKNLKSSGKWKTLWMNEVGSKIGVSIAPEPPGDEWKK